MRMSTIKDLFIQAIKSKKKVRLSFDSKEDGAPITRLCAPVDFGPSRRAKDKSDRYHLWDYEGKRGPHIISIVVPRVIAIEILEEAFDPAEFAKKTWSLFIPRDWGTLP